MPISSADARDNPEPAVVSRVLDFWFGAPGTPEHGTRRAVWFAGGAEFDTACAALRDDYEQASSGAYDGLTTTGRGTLAVLILLDQIPRNLFRGDRRSYATDPKARAVSSEAVRRGLDLAFPAEQRVFFYMPLEHSEHLADQERCMVLMAAIGDAEWLHFARLHRDIVARFGRFPHRNAVLGRVTTPEEQVFLTQPNSSFGAPVNPAASGSDAC